MTVAAKEAVVLRQLLESVAEDHDPLASLRTRYFESLPQLLDAPWSAAVADFVYPETTGERPQGFEQSMKFAGALLRLAVEDPEVQRLVTEVQQLLKPPSVYHDPRLGERVERTMAEMTA